MLKKIMSSVLITGSSLQLLAENPPVDYAKFAPQAKEIVSHMSLEEKIGQMTLASIEFLYHDGGLEWISKAKIGGTLALGNTIPKQGPSLNHWQALMNEIKSHHVQLNDGTIIPLLLGTDAIHGDQHVANAVIFPHNIGLGAAQDPELVFKIAQWTAYDVLKSGFNWTFAPVVAVAHDYRWGRTYESFSSNPELVMQLATAYIRGAQMIENQRLHGVLTSTKHFIGDGNTDLGIDQGNAIVTNFSQFHKENYPGYAGAFLESTGNVMVSYSSINDLPMSVNQEYLQQNLFPHFSGFVVSDYEAISAAAAKLRQPFDKVLADAVNSGLDMFMIGHQVPYYKSIVEFQQILLGDIQKGWITPERIDQAVTRILQVKIAMGLLDPNHSSMSQPGEDENQIALRAAEKSLVLLKNQSTAHPQVLPVDPKAIEHVILLGDQGYTYSPEGVAQGNGIYKFDDIGSQCGGWRVLWQGIEGNQYTDSNASSILSGVKNTLGASVSILPNPGDLERLLDGQTYTSKNTIAIAVIAEFPYAEFMGDVGNHNPLYGLALNPYAPPKQLRDLILDYDGATLQRIKLLKAAGIPVITVLLSGRPMIIHTSDEAPLNQSDAFIAAWLPGTTGGQAIANAIFGRYHFGKDGKANRLPFAWPAAMDQVGKLACLGKGDEKIEPLFPCGFGLFPH